MTDDSQLSETKSVADWLAKDELLKSEPDFIHAVGEMSRGKVGLVFELNQAEWRRKLQEKATKADADWDALINRFLNKVVPAAASDLGKTW